MRGEGKGEGDLRDYFTASGRERVGVKELRNVSKAPLTLTLSPKGRGEITFDNT